LKKLKTIAPQNHHYQLLNSTNFYTNIFFENYKMDMHGYTNIEMANYKIFINSIFNKKIKTSLPKHINFINKNKTNLDKLLNVILINGDKLKFLKSLNKMVSIFYFSFIHKSVFLQNKFDTYTLFYNFSKENDFFFNFDFILNNIITLNESIFNIKVLKLNKRNKKRLKKKYDFEIKYLKKEKRAGNVFKSLHLFSNSFNYYKYNERILAAIFTTFFFQKSSKIYKKKLLAYSSILKKKSL
jgi:hypothetical protein